jgi:hypothetical protein
MLAGLSARLLHDCGYVHTLVGSGGGLPRLIRKPVAHRPLSASVGGSRPITNWGSRPGTLGVTIGLRDALMAL